MESSPNQVKVIFTTNEPGLQLPESKQQLLVPAGQSILSHTHPSTGAIIEQC